MKLMSIALAALAVTALGITARAQNGDPKKDLIVHEWGTFLSMNGSDGVTLDGMYHEEHALPGFVHSRSQEELFQHEAILKGETPVIYFYTKQRQHVSVKVSFPRGVWTQWFPQAAEIVPEGRHADNPLPAGGSSILWNAFLMPPHTTTDAFPVPKTSPDSLWNFARDVDAAYVMASDFEVERFLFYRGLGSSNLPLGFTNEDGGTVSLSASDPITLNHLFVIRVEHGKGAYRYISSISPGNHIKNVFPDMSAAKPLGAFTSEIETDVAARLTASGLFAKEARAMVNTWANSYFKTDGVRVLYLLPQRWTDAFIPMEIKPQPASIVRVMVGRTELLMPDRENKVAAAIRNLTSDNQAARERAFVTLQDQGRYLEPILRHEAKAAPDATVRRLSEQLLNTDFVNRIRPEVYRPDDGARVVTLPTADEARLAALLKQLR